MSPARALLDTNVILRFLLADHETLSPRARDIFGQAAANEMTLVVSGVVLAECVYTLKSFYKLARPDISAALETLLSLPNVEPLEPSLRQALQLFADHNVDFADAYLAALGSSLGHNVATFDRDVGKLGAAVL